MRISSCEAMVRPLSRKADFRVDDKTAVGRIQNTGSTLQNFLPAAAYPQQTTFAGTASRGKEYGAIVRANWRSK